MVSAWADKYRVLTSESSAEAGQWKTSRAEYQRGIMDSLNDRNIENIVIMSSSQVGKTEIILNILGYHIAHDPAPMLVVMPTLEMARGFSTQRLSKMIASSEALKNKVKDSKRSVERIMTDISVLDGVSNIKSALHSLYDALDDKHEAVNETIYFRK